MSLQNFFNVLIVLLILIQFQSTRAHDHQIHALFYITDTLRDILIDITKENKDEEKDTL